MSVLLEINQQKKILCKTTTISERPSVRRCVFAIIRQPIVDAKPTITKSTSQNATKQHENSDWRVYKTNRFYDFPHCLKINSGKSLPPETKQIKNHFKFRLYINVWFLLSEKFYELLNHVDRPERESNGCISSIRAKWVMFDKVNIALASKFRQIGQQ